MKYFTGCKTAEDVKVRFKDLAKKLHPDCGGDAEEFKAMMNEYNIVYDRLKNVHARDDHEQDHEQTAGYTGEYTAEQFADIIIRVITFDGVDVEIVGRWIWLSGNTYAYKDDIKAAGFFWSSKHKKWYYNGATKKSKKHSKLNYEQVKRLHGCKKVKSFQPRFQPV